MLQTLPAHMPPPTPYPTNVPLCTQPQAEYAKLQGQYEELKAARIDEEIAALLEQQNAHVSEHGAKAAQLAEHYRAEVGAAAGSL